MIRERQYREGDHLSFEPKALHLEEMGERPTDALKLSIENSSEVYTLVIGDEVVGIGGVRTAHMETPLVWLICSEKATESHKAFIRLTSRFLDYWHSKYGKNQCWLLAENKESIRWLRFNGYREVERVHNGRQWVCYERF